ncbi:MAG: hypothetical protein OEY34_05125 [Cyclobacteriaceae bacterium]|nr:hypothetical protein [Cyclobacteriaceae bacterium]
MNILNLDRSFQIEVDKFQFQGNIPLPKDDIDIDLAVGRRLNGVPIESIPNATYGYILACCTLDKAITRRPRELEFLESWENHDDYDFVIELYNKFHEKKEAFSASLKKNKHKRTVNSEPRTDSRPVLDEGNETTSKPEFDFGQIIPGSKKGNNRSNVDNGELPELSSNDRTIPGASGPSESKSAGNASDGSTKFSEGRGAIRPGQT